MVIAQTVVIASNPNQLKMMANQMKNITESKIRQAVNQSPPHTPLVLPAAAGRRRRAIIRAQRSPCLPIPVRTGNTADVLPVP